MNKPVIQTSLNSDLQMHWLVDENVTTSMIDLITRAGHEITCVGDGLRKASDNVVFRYACDHEYPILTMDKDFVSFIQHDHTRSRGILILPQSARGIVEHTERMCMRAFNHFTSHYISLMVQRGGLVFHYRDKGDVEVFESDFRSPTRRKIADFQRYTNG